MVSYYLPAASSPPPYESVTINLSGGISCSERLLLDRRDGSSLSVDRYTRDVSTSLEIDLGALASIGKSSHAHELRQRCEELIKIAQAHAEERVIHLKLESDRLRSEIEKEKIRNKLDAEHLKQSLQDFGDEW